MDTHLCSNDVFFALTFRVHSIQIMSSQPPKIEELPDDTPVEEDKKLDEVISQWEKLRYVPKAGEPALPPQLSQFTDKLTNEVMNELNRLPFFMTALDETDGKEGTNIELEALRSLAYEGEPDEIATNFKNQGNDRFKAKDYQNAIAYYTKGLDIECNDDKVNVALLINRAACNLELKNYRRCIDDCKKALGIDEKNSKACYRAGKALFKTGHLEEARQVLQYGLSFDANNASIKQTLDEVVAKETQIKEAKEKKERDAKLAEMKKSILDNSIKLRHIDIVHTNDPPEMLRNATLKLEDEKDYQSQLIFPAMVLYPTIDEFDFIAEIGELATPLEILEMLLNRPLEWFEDPKHKNFSVKKLQVFMETTTGGLIKVGKKIAVNEPLMNDKPKAPMFDNGLRLYVVPQPDVEEWLKGWNKNIALSKRK